MLTSNASTDRPPEYYSSGQVMALTSLGVPTIRQVCAELGHQPAFYLNGTDYYELAAVQALRRYIAEQQQ